MEQLAKRLQTHYEIARRPILMFMFRQLINKKKGSKKHECYIGSIEVLNADLLEVLKFCIEKKLISNLKPSLEYIDNFIAEGRKETGDDETIIVFLVTFNYDQKLFTTELKNQIERTQRNYGMSLDKQSEIVEAFILQAIAKKKNCGYINFLDMDSDLLITVNPFIGFLTLATVRFKNSRFYCTTLSRREYFYDVCGLDDPLPTREEFSEEEDYFEALMDVGLTESPEDLKRGTKIRDSLLISVGDGSRALKNYMKFKKSESYEVLKTKSGSIEFWYDEKNLNGIAFVDGVMFCKTSNFGATEMKILAALLKTKEHRLSSDQLRTATNRSVNTQSKSSDEGFLKRACTHLRRILGTEKFPKAVKDALKPADYYLLV